VLVRGGETREALIHKRAARRYRPTGGGRHFAPQLAAAIHSTSEPDWVSAAIDNLLDYIDVEIDGVFVRARSLNPRQAVWPRLRARLKAHGLRTPRQVPGERWP
jgi:hypothetical protein